MTAMTINTRIDENSVAIQSYIANAYILSQPISSAKVEKVNKKVEVVKAKKESPTTSTKATKPTPKSSTPDLPKETTTVSNPQEDDIQTKIYEAEKALIKYPSYVKPEPNEHSQILRVYKDIISNSMYSAVWKWVPSNYYNESLATRAKILGAHTTFQLCKSMLMENKAYDPSIDVNKSIQDKMNSRFYLVILQYETSIATKKLQSEVRALQPLKTRLEPSKFDFRVASEEHNATLTGFTHNAVAPFGIAENVPIILSKAILDSDMTQFIWLGAGHVHLKVGVAVSDLISVKDPLVLDVTE